MVKHIVESEFVVLDVLSQVYLAPKLELDLGASKLNRKVSVKKFAYEC